MDMMQRRAALIGSLKSNIAYEAYNLSFDGTDSTVIDTGVYLFTQENINKDFEFIADGINGTGAVSSNTIICAKHNGKSYGFLVRPYNSTSTTYKGTIYVKNDSNAIVIIRRVGGVITLSGENITNLGVQIDNGVFDRPLVLGCAVDDDGSRYRYAQGTIQHIKLKWL